MLLRRAPRAHDGYGAAPGKILQHAADTHTPARCAVEMMVARADVTRARMSAAAKASAKAARAAAAATRVCYGCRCPRRCRAAPRRMAPPLMRAAVHAAHAPLRDTVC